MDVFPDSPDDPDMLTRSQAAAFLGIGERALHYRRKKGKLPDGTVFIFDRTDGGYPLVRYSQTKLEQIKASQWRVVPEGNAEAAAGDDQT